MSAHRDRSSFFADLANAIENLDSARQKALAGDEDMIARFLTLGLTLLEIEGKTPCELYLAMTQRRTS